MKKLLYLALLLAVSYGYAQNTFPDYVFKKDYNLMPINELKNYITKNQHLPNIPSEKEVVENGIGVGELQIKMMEKIEELTLYIIQQQEEIETLKAAIKEK